MTTDKSITPDKYLKLKIDNAFEVLSKLNALNSKIKNYNVMTRREMEEANYKKDELCSELRHTAYKINEIVKEIDKVAY